MSLQGTLDTFALPDVLRLLASTGKTGHLRLEGSRGRGGVWFAAGKVAAATPPRSDGAASPVPPSAEAIFELLRCPDGSFAFEAGAASPLEVDLGEVDHLLRAAEELLEEWREVAAVVPWLGCSVALRPELEGPSATVSAHQWRLLVAVGGATTVGDLGTALALGELSVSREVKGLVEAGLVELGDAPAQAEPEPADEIHVGEAANDEPERDEREEAAPQAAVASLEREEQSTAEIEAVGGFRRRPLTAIAGSPRPGRRVTEPTGDDDDTAAVARRLAELGPDAAAKVAAAADASTTEERDAALDAIDADVDGQPVNRSALLKFLSSVRS